MIKLINNQDDSIKYFTNGGRSNYYFINSEYLREMSKNRISLIKLEFNLIFKTLVITDLSLLKIVMAIGLIVNCILFYNAQDVIQGYDSIAIASSFVIFYIVSSVFSFAILAVLSLLTNLSDRLKQLYLLMRFNVMNFKK